MQTIDYDTATGALPGRLIRGPQAAPTMIDERVAAARAALFDVTRKPAMSAQVSRELVRRVCSKWPMLSRAELHAMLASDCLYINMPMPQGRCIGPDQTYDLLATFVGGRTIDMQVLHMQGDASTVLTERRETFCSKADPGKVVKLHVVGTVEIKDGKIAHWRDYFNSRESQALLS